MGPSYFMHVAVLYLGTALSADPIVAVSSIKSNPLSHGEGTNPSITMFTPSAAIGPLTH